jgi:hypothetical protein
MVDFPRLIRRRGTGLRSICPISPKMTLNASKRGEVAAKSTAVNTITTNDLHG